MTRLRRFFLDEHAMLALIVLNTLLMFLGGFWPDSLWFELSDAFFTLLFVMEAVVKITTLGWAAYWRSGWNRFDFLVVVIALPSLASPFVEHSLATGAILALRSFRVFKMFKLLRFIPHLPRLLQGVRLAVRASLLVCVAGFAVLFIFAILSSALFGSSAPQYFGNPALSVYNTFRLFSVEGWYELPDAIAAHSGAAWAVFARVYFSLLLFLGGILGMSLITSIFVDAMAGDNNDAVLAKLDELEQELRELKEQRGEGR